MGARVIDEQELSFETESDIQYSFRRITARANSRSAAAGILLLEFAGPYGVGSAGHRDAAFLVAMSQAALSLWPANALIFDLRKLEYVWGDDIYELFDVPRLVGFEVPAAVVTSNLSHAPLKGIIASGIDEPSVSVFLSYQEALSHILSSLS